MLKHLTLKKHDVSSVKVQKIQHPKIAKPTLDITSSMGLQSFDL
jgi:hypothetical protein